MYTKKKYSAADLAEAKEMLEAGCPVTWVAKQTGISRTTLSSRLLGQKEIFDARNRAWQKDNKEYEKARQKKNYTTRKNAENKPQK